MQDPGHRGIKLLIEMLGDHFLRLIVRLTTLNKKVGQDLCLHRRPQVIGDIEFIDFDHPFGHPSRGVRPLQDGSKWLVGQDDD